MSTKVERHQVELIASGNVLKYEWIGPKCPAVVNREIEASATVECRKCHTQYEVSEYLHATA